MRMLAAFPGAGWDVTVHLVRARKGLPKGIGAAEAMGGILRHVPFRWISSLAKRRLTRQFVRALDRAPAGSIAWFWPDAPVELVRHAHSRGMVTVREMINSAQSLLSFPLRAQTMLCVMAFAIVLLARSPTAVLRERKP